MEIPNKKSGDFELPVIGIGTWEIGGRFDRDTKNDKRDISAIQYAVQQGFTHIDTAEMYAAGHAEEIISQAISGLDRDSLFITSKVAPENLSYENVIRSCQNSLARLSTDYLNLYLIHAPNPTVPIEQTMRAMNDLLSQKLIRNIGVSNFQADELALAQQYSQAPIVCNQVHYNLAARAHEESGLFEYCRQHNVLINAYRPIKFNRQNPLRILQSDLVVDVAKKYHKSPVQIVLNWVLSKQNIVTIFKSVNPEHIDENLGALGWSMEEEDMKFLENNFERGETAWGPNT